MLTYIYGHRGARGLYPENTLKGFKKVLNLPVNGIELDVVVSKDHQLVVSHEPWMNSLICTTPSGEPILKSTEKKHNLYLMNYSEIKKYDCGKQHHLQFPNQELFSAHKPLLQDVFKLLTPKTNQEFTLLLEIKSNPNWYGIFHPSIEVYSELIVTFLKEHESKMSIIIQSFDATMLNAIHQISPFYKMGLLIENKCSIEENLNQLNFTPNYYMMFGAYVTRKKVATLREKSIELIPWNINSKKEALRVEKIGITSIITDYPNLFLLP